MIERIYFDFGGCLDAPGIHTRTLFWDAFLAEHLQDPDQRARFQDAYTLADQRMMSTGEVQDFGLAAFNRWNAALMADTLGVDRLGATRAADRVTEQMRGFLARSREALGPIAERWHLSVISNFTGNLEVILREHELRNFFDSVTESYHVGVSKPDLKIFQTALGKHGEAPGRSMYVGDNPVNDIAPARELGMRTALIHRPGEKKDCGADFYLEDLAALPSLIQSR